MQTREYAGPFVDRNPDYTGVPWTPYGASSSHIDGSNATGYKASDPSVGNASLAHVMGFDDGAIPSLSTIQALRIRYTLGDTALVTQGALPVVPYVRFDGGAPVFQERLSPAHAAAFTDFLVEFPLDPDGLPWTRDSIFRKRGKLLLFGLRSNVVDLLSAQILWSECRFGVDFNLPVPLVVTDPASLISSTGAQLNGRLNPRGANGAYPLTWWFDYGTTTAYGSQTTPVANVTGDLDMIVTATVAGLATSVGYHYRLTAQTADGLFHGEDQFFTTDASASGRFRLDEFKRIATGQWLAGDRTRLTSPGFDRPSTAADDLSCPFLIFP